MCDWTVDNGIYLFFGYCKIFKGVFYSYENEWPKVMAGRLKEIISKNEPNPIFTFHHSGYPSHTGPGFQYDNEEDLNLYKKSFYENSEYLLPILEEIIDNFETINIRNRSKIVFIFGDHGSFVSRNFKNFNIKFKINDEHGILFMIVNNTGCSLKNELL